MTDSSTTGPYGVIGATGQQGGAVASALFERGVPVRALVREPDADSARELAARGAELARVDLDDAASLRAAFTGLTALFAMTTFTGGGGTEGEVVHGRAVADAALATGVPHVVYSSVGGAERDTGIPHFDSKWRIEQYLREQGVPTSVVRPTFFMENFTGFFTPSVEDGVSVLRAPLLPDVPLQLVAVADIGAAAAALLLDPERLSGGAIEIAGDELTGVQVAERFADAAGLPGRFEPLPLDSLGDDDQEAMFGWFRHLPAYTADFAGTRDLVPDVLDFTAFLTRRGTPRG